jgi:hypothetical protein
MGGQRVVDIGKDHPDLGGNGIGHLGNRAHLSSRFLQMKHD